MRSGASPLSAQADIRTTKDPDFNPGSRRRDLCKRSIAWPGILDDPRAAGRVVVGDCISYDAVSSDQCWEAVAEATALCVSHSCTASSDNPLTVKTLSRLL